jgi:hypothetical protein
LHLSDFSTPPPVSRKSHRAWLVRELRPIGKAFLHVHVIEALPSWQRQHKRGFRSHKRAIFDRKILLIAKLFNAQ